MRYGERLIHSLASFQFGCVHRDVTPSAFVNAVVKADGKVKSKLIISHFCLARFVYDPQHIGNTKTGDTA